MTCEHSQITRETYYDLSRVECRGCGHHWREAPIRMTAEEYDGAVLMLARFQLEGRDHVRIK
jgi:Zn ribbon nucleic-acid-binding protein